MKVLCIGCETENEYAWTAVVIYRRWPWSEAQVIEVTRTYYDERFRLTRSYVELEPRLARELEDALARRQRTAASHLLL